MGYVHHSIYPLYFEIGRTELMRKTGLNYKNMEDSGIILPVVNMNIDYSFPAYYDDLLIVETKFKSFSGVRIVFDYQVKRKSNNDLVCKAETTLVFVDAESRRPTRAPEEMQEIIRKGITTVNS
jgi:acyl-CoA thioester hydrolase